MTGGEYPFTYIATFVKAISAFSPDVVQLFFGREKPFVLGITIYDNVQEKEKGMEFIYALGFKKQKPVDQ